MIIQILILIILIACNAFFAASEIAFISLNDLKIEKQAKEGNKKARSIYDMLKNPSRFLATIQIGITLAGFLSSAFASDAFADDLAPILNLYMPLFSIQVWRGISIVLITIILSFFTLVFGELVPKRIAMKNYEKIAFGTIEIIRTISFITSPFVKLLTTVTNIISKIFGVNETDEEIVTEEEIKMMVNQGREKGTIQEEEQVMINKVFQLDDKVASSVMTHRRDIFAIEINSDLKEKVKEIEGYKYSRIPVYEETIDQIKGMIFVKDLFRALINNEKIKIKDMLREAYFVPESKPINELFRELQHNKKQMAVVIDEFGGTAGIITMEDILEELVGNIFDEYDEIENEYEKLDENTFLMNGSLNMEEVKEILGIEIEDGDYETLSGYLLEQLGRVPADNEKPIIETEQATFKVEEYREKRIILVKACRNEQKEKEELE